MNMLRRFINGLLDIVYPKLCLACKNKLNIHGNICTLCLAKIRKNTPPFCHCCGRRLEKSNITKSICPGCIKKNLYFDRAFSPCVYEGVIKELIHEFKYKGKEHLGLPLSKLMIEFIREYNLPVDYLDCIVPVPLHRVRLREREFNQAEVLAKFISQEFKKELLACAIQRHRHTQTQTDLDVDKRALNVKGSFSITRSDDIKGKNIMLVDDVLTTGATSSEAALTLKNAGANIVFVLTLAN